MKRLVLIGALALLPVAAYCGEDDTVPGTEPEDPWEDPVAVKYREDTARFEQIIHNFKTLDAYAGAYNELNFRGVTWIVDRSMETRKITPSPGTIAAGAAATGALVKDLRGNAKGSVQVRITYREIDHKTGKTTEMVFEVSSDGSFQVDTGGFQESQQKQHK